MSSKLAEEIHDFLWKNYEWLRLRAVGIAIPKLCAVLQQYAEEQFVPKERVRAALRNRLHCPKECRALDGTSSVHDGVAF